MAQSQSSSLTGLTVTTHLGHSLHARRYVSLIRALKVWEHAKRDVEDVARHFNYIHYNPVKQVCAGSRNSL